MRDPGGDLGARGDKSLREEAERVLCNGEEAVKPAAKRRKGGEGSPAVPISAFHIRLSRVFFDPSYTVWRERQEEVAPRASSGGHIVTIVHDAAVSVLGR